MLLTLKLTNQVKSLFSTKSSLQQGQEIIIRNQNLLPFYDIINPEYAVKRLTNHFPMAIISLIEMGATKQQLLIFEEEFLTRKNYFYEKQVEIPKNVSQNLINDSNIDKYVGDFQFYELFLQFFKEQAKNQSLESLIQKYLPRFSNGIGSEAFHIIIKLGYAIHFKMNREEILQSLAYLLCQQVTMNKSTFKGTKTDIFEILNDIQNNKQTFVEKTTFHKGMVFNHQLNYLFKDEEFLKYLPKEQLKISLDMLPALEEFLVKLFIHTNCSFLILHALTGFASLKKILYIFSEEQQIQLINDYLLFVFTFYAGDKQQIKDTRVLKLGYPIEIPQNMQSWETIKKEAVKRFDDHDIKLTFVAYDESKKLLEKNPNSELAKLYQLAAIKQLKL